VTERDLVRAVVEEFSAVAAAMVGGEPHLEPSDEGLSAVWAMAFTASGALAGPLTLAVTAEDASRLACLVMGFDEPPGDDVVIDSVQEMAQQMASAVTVKLGPALTLGMGGPVVSIPSAAGGAEWLALVLGDMTLHMAVWHELEPGAVATAAAVGQPTAAAPVSAPQRPSAGTGSSSAGNLELILDIELPLWVRFGETAMTLQALTKIGPGTTLDLERSPDDPVDMMVNNTVIARGEVVVVAGNYGIRVTEVVSPTERIRSLAG
jgi:flagellar motor switch protein FliN